MVICCWPNAGLKGARRDDKRVVRGHSEQDFIHPQVLLNLAVLLDLNRPRDHDALNGVIVAVEHRSLNCPVRRQLLC